MLKPLSSSLYRYFYTQNSKLMCFVFFFFSFPFLIHQKITCDWWTLTVPCTFIQEHTIFNKWFMKQWGLVDFLFELYDLLLFFSSSLPLFIIFYFHSVPSLLFLCSFHFFYLIFRSNEILDIGYSVFDGIDKSIWYNFFMWMISKWNFSCGWKNENIEPFFQPYIGHSEDQRDEKKIPGHECNENKVKEKKRNEIHEFIDFNKIYFHWR